MDAGWGTVIGNLVFPIILCGTVFVALYLFIRRQRARKRFSPITEDMLRTPAQALQRELEDLNDQLYFGMSLAIIPPLFVLVGARSNLIAWVAVAVIAAFGFWLLLRTLSKSLQLRLAIDGEEYTGGELNYLMREGARVYHDIPYQYGNIDHIVVSTGGVFAVETKTYRKPAGERESSRQSNVTFDGKALAFPGFQTSRPLDQARQHAKHTQESIRKNVDLEVLVTPVVALPGWFVSRSGWSDVWVINPKRGGALAAQVKKSVITAKDAERIANYVESVVRSVPAASKKMDPDAGKHYDFWNKRRFEERRLG